MVSPFTCFNTISLKEIISKKLFISPTDISNLVIEKRSVDARSKQAGFQIRGKVYLGESPPEHSKIEPFKSVVNKSSVIIIGAGPAGFFAALRLIQLGIKPIILERGKEVRERRRDLAKLNRFGLVNPESNYCFGEGGAGTYSDGKLYTRSSKRGNIETILDLFIHFGANPDIKIDARPHIGTNLLPGIISKMREEIQNSGGEVHFGQKLTEIHHSGNQVRAITSNGDQKWETNQLILATGHSSKDVFYLLHRSGIQIEPKPFALGVRVEHPQVLIDQIQYHSSIRNEFLPPAYYGLIEQIDSRGVFSFCMCPGGIIAPCTTDSEAVVVNGWSPSKRNNPYANSGMVVQIELEDIPKNFTRLDPFYALEFQSNIEKNAHLLGGGNQKAPAQRLVDFTQNITSSDLPKCSYIPGVTSVNFSDLLPNWVLNKLQKAFPIFGNKMKGFFTNEALVVGVESRTSSPIKIPRDPISLQHPELNGLFPIGEGAGYAGGILSAAMDGYRVAEVLAAEMANSSN